MGKTVRVTRAPGVSLMRTRGQDGAVSDRGKDGLPWQTVCSDWGRSRRCALSGALLLILLLYTLSVLAHRLALLFDLRQLAFAFAFLFCLFLRGCFDKDHRFSQRQYPLVTDVFARCLQIQSPFFADDGETQVIGANLAGPFERVCGLPFFNLRAERGVEPTVPSSTKDLGQHIRSPYRKTIIDKYG